MKEHFLDTELPLAFAVDPEGAYLIELCDANGQPILCDRTEIDGRTRGGCHVCLPNFGPDVSGKLSQHGFGREVTWEEVPSDDEHVKEFRMACTEGEYAGLIAALRYQYEPEGDSPHMTMRLSVYNGRTDGKELRVAPAFHPYFAVPQGEEMSLNGDKLDIKQYADAKYIDGTLHTLRIGDRVLTLQSDQLTKWALWTDGRGQYFCVEPTLDGPSFASPGTPNEKALLRRNELKTYEFRIDWQ